MTNKTVFWLLSFPKQPKQLVCKGSLLLISLSRWVSTRNSWPARRPEFFLGFHVFCMLCYVLYLAKRNTFCSLTYFICFIFVQGFFARSKCPEAARAQSSILLESCRHPVDPCSGSLCKGVFCWGLFVICWRFVRLAFGICIAVWEVPR